MDLEMVTIYLVINDMESELSEVEKTKDVALGEVWGENSPMYSVSGGGREAQEEN